MKKPSISDLFRRFNRAGEEFLAEKDGKDVVIDVFPSSGNLGHEIFSDLIKGTDDFPNYRIKEINGFLRSKYLFTSKELSLLGDPELQYAQKLQDEVSGKNNGNRKNFVFLQDLVRHHRFEEGSLDHFLVYSPNCRLSKIDVTEGAYKKAVKEKDIEKAIRIQETRGRILATYPELDSYRCKKVLVKKIQQTLNQELLKKDKIEKIMGEFPDYFYKRDVVSDDASNILAAISFGNWLKEIRSKTMVIVETNPQDIIGYSLWASSGLPGSRVFGGTNHELERLKSVLTNNLESITDNQGNRMYQILNLEIELYGLHSKFQRPDINSSSFNVLDRESGKTHEEVGIDFFSEKGREAWEKAILYASEEYVKQVPRLRGRTARETSLGVLKTIAGCIEPEEGKLFRIEGLYQNRDRTYIWTGFPATLDSRGYYPKPIPLDLGDEGYRRLLQEKHGMLSAFLRRLEEEGILPVITEEEVNDRENQFDNSLKTKKREPNEEKTRIINVSTDKRIRLWYEKNSKVIEGRPITINGNGRRREVTPCSVACGKIGLENMVIVGHSGGIEVYDEDLGWKNSLPITDPSSEQGQIRSIIIERSRIIGSHFKEGKEQQFPLNGIYIESGKKGLRQIVDERTGPIVNFHGRIIYSQYNELYKLDQNMKKAVLKPIIKTGANISAMSSSDEFLVLGDESGTAYVLNDKLELVSKGPATTISAYIQSIEQAEYNGQKLLLVGTNRGALYGLDISFPEEKKKRKLFYLPIGADEKRPSIRKIISIGDDVHLCTSNMQIQLSLEDLMKKINGDLTYINSIPYGGSTSTIINFDVIMRGNSR